MNSLSLTCLKGIVLLSIVVAVSSCKESFILASRNLPAAQLATVKTASKNALAEYTANIENQYPKAETACATPVKITPGSISRQKFIRQEIVHAKAFMQNYRQSLTLKTPTVTAGALKGGKKIDPFGVLAILLEAAAIYVFFGFHMPILAAILLIGGIIAAVRSIKRCNDIDKYGGKSIPLIASIFGSIALFLLLVLVIVLGVIVPLA